MQQVEKLSAPHSTFGSIIMWVIARRGFWRMADTVEDHGDRLVITRWRTKVEVPIASVKEIVRLPNLNGSNVTIVLNAPCATSRKSWIAWRVAWHPSADRARHRRPKWLTRI